jgi:hypothetical protein
MEFFYNNKKDKQNLDNSSGNTHKEYDVVSENSDNDSLPSLESSRIHMSKSDGLLQNLMDSVISPIPDQTEPKEFDTSSGCEPKGFDEEEIEYDDESENESEIKEPSYEEIVISLKKEIEIWKLKYELCNIKNNIYGIEENRFNSLLNKESVFNPTYFNNSEFFKDFKIVHTPDKQRISENNFWKLGVLSGCVAGSYLSILLIGISKYMNC